MSEKEEIMMDNVKNLGLVLLDARRLNRLWRWPGLHIMGDIRPSVAAHSFTVMQTAQLLGKIEETEFGTRIDWKSLYEKALNHDFLEAYTGDIKGPVKNHDPEVKRRIEELENIFAHHYLYKRLSPTYASIYKEVFTNGKDDTIEGQILKASDIIDLIIESLCEIIAGNPTKEFLDAYVDGLVKLKKIPLKSVNVFLTVTIYELLDASTVPFGIREMTKQLLDNDSNDD